MTEAIVVLSGGMDSTTLAYLLRSHGTQFDALTIDYGQRHRKEIDYARATAERLSVSWELANLSGLGDLLGGSALTDDVEVPEGHYADETMKATVVPNRNAIMLSVAFGVAVARGANRVAFAAHAGDHAVYPDCRPEFVIAFNTMIRVATEGFADPGLQIHAPFINQTKADIARLGIGLGIDYSLTWSCYKGEEIHCGECGTCVERREAFDLIGHSDPTEYATAWDGIRVSDK